MFKENILKVVVFDLGGTLMQYIGMPYSWVDFYYQGFNAIAEKYCSSFSTDKIQASVDILKQFNPRVNYRENEYSAEYIFSTALDGWDLNVSIQECVETFWKGLNLKAEIYDDTISVINELKHKGYAIAVLTDLPNAMPDYIFKKDIEELLSYFDFYVSSSLAGYRKPNIAGLKMISDKFNTSLCDLIFIGDEEKDRQTAINANCKFIKIDRTKKSDNSIGDLSALINIL